MKITTKIYSVSDLLVGFTFDEKDEKGLFGLNGNLIIQPDYQRNYIYGDGKKDVNVIKTLLRSGELGMFYFNKRETGELEVLDGQQRITSIGRFVKNKFSIIDDEGKTKNFDSLSKEKQDLILDTKLLVKECECTEDELAQLFFDINIAGYEMNQQEKLNHVYCGPFLNLAKKEFSNSKNVELMKREVFIKGSVKRQDHLRTALEWISRSKDVTGYLSKHRYDDNIDELKDNFNSVIEWAASLFDNKGPEMKSVNWGELYDKFHDNPYDVIELNKVVDELYGNYFVKNKKGIFEYVLGGCKDTKLLNVRVFDTPVKTSVYKKQTEEAKLKGVSNCPLCAVGNNPNKDKIWTFKDMDADHVKAWSKGGDSSQENCEMLCKTHNRAKGNK